MKIEVGKTYLNGKGDRVLIIDVNSESNPPVVGRLASGIHKRPVVWLYDMSGGYENANGDGDLISEYIDPGEGWRLLEEGELIEDGDHYLCPSREEWTSSTGNPNSGKTQSACYSYRRKIKPPEPELLEGYEFCGKDSAELTTYRHTKDSKWVKGWDLLGLHCFMYGDDQYRFCRKIKQEKTPMEELLYCCEGLRDDYSARNFGSADEWCRHIANAFDSYEAEQEGE